MEQKESLSMKLQTLSATSLLLVFSFQAHWLSAESSLKLTRVGTGFSRPVFALMPPGETDRLFVLEQHTGRIEILNLNDGSVEDEPFLDLNRLSTGNEQGLLGMAFDPDYQNNGHFYLNFTESSGATNVQRFTVSDNPNVADDDSRFPIMRFNQPQGNHNAGWIDFGPNDGYLYISSGDGGGADDSGGGHTARIGNAQDLTNNFLGKMLRVDVRGDAFPEDDRRNYQIPQSNPFVDAEGDDEIWSYGLRNPWRNAFDRANGDLYMGDVGQGAREEISFQPANSPGGENYGWRLREGTVRTPGVGGDEPADHVPPIHEYRHTQGPDGGFSITGGYVYRGPIEELNGAYFFADFVTNQIWSIRYDGAETSDLTNWTETIRTDAGSVIEVSSFAEDNQANVYVISLGGDIFRIDDLQELTSIVPDGSVWKYLDDGSDQGTNWITLDFNDDGWKEGPAQLGYGDGDEDTVVEFGPDSRNRFRTTYFRHEFDVTDLDSFESLQLGLLYDDGAAVYLNGTEIARAQLDPGAAFDDFATASRGGPAEDAFESFEVDLANLIEGTNVLAVEVHQRSGGSSDLSFDLKLNGILRELLASGDFNMDGTIDALDIDLISTALVDNDQSSQFDLSGDGIVDQNDRILLISDEIGTWIGDSNLDGEFNSSDLVEVFDAGEYEDAVPRNSTWSEGDWNGDLDFSTADLVFAFQEGGFEMGPRQATQSVPEPNGLLLFFAGSICAIISRRRR